MVAGTCFGITLPSSGSVPRAFWDMLNWGEVDSGAWTAPRHWTQQPIHIVQSTAPQLSISQKALGSLPEDDNVIPKYVGATIYN
jgi:hypothetical protein